MSSPGCLCCGNTDLEMIIDFGEQPPSNRYQQDADSPSEKHGLKFAYCTQCGLPQLVDPMQLDSVRSRYEWITYNEPEGHLDDLVQRVLHLIDDRADVRVTGISYKDDTTLERMSKLGVKHTYRLDQVNDLGISNGLASLETIQQELNNSKAQEIVVRHGLSDVLVVRHILEHAHEPMHFLEMCSAMVKPDGLLIFEVPDCRKVLGGNDHCFIWEEHRS